MRHGDFYSFPIEGTQGIPIAVEMAGIDYCHENYRVVRKNSDVSVLAYVLSGSGTIQVDSLTFYAKKGDVFILRKGSNHEYFTDKNNEWVFLWFNIKGDFFKQLLAAYIMQNVCIVEDCDTRNLFERGIRTAAQKYENLLIVQNRLSSLIFKIVLDMSLVLKERKINISEDALKIKNYLDNHIEEKISLDQISKYTCLTTRQINRIFKKELGRTPYDYVLTKKIELAKSYLINTSLSVKEVACRLNFIDAYYFSNIFKEKTGLSPIYYKKAING